MKKMKASILFFLLCIAALTLPCGAIASGNMDVVLVMDSSGSMKKTDPHYLRIPAAKLFISLLGEGDRASVVSFSDKGYTISPMIPVAEEANVSRLNSAAEKISSKGLFTNLYEAFFSGIKILSDSAEPDREKIILIMTDGMMDSGDKTEDVRLLGLIDSELLGRMKEQNIKVYSIAFTRLSDQKLLEKISKKTGGFYNLALTDKELHLIFTSIFESLKKPDMLPMNKNSFLVDSSVREVTIVATKGSAETDIKLLSPDGQKYSGTRKYSGIAWFQSETFDMITIERPLEGRWEILLSTGKDNKAYVITDLSLKTNFSNLYSLFGQPMDINIWLEKDGAPIAEPDVLEKIEFYIELTGPDGKTSRLEPFLKEPGVFERKIAPFTPGNYTMNIVAKGMTFEREKTFVFNSATVEESKEDIKEQKEEAEKAAPAEVKTEAAPQDKGISWAAVIVKFIAINLIIGLGVIIYIKRGILIKGKLGKLLKRGSGEDHDEDDEDYEDYDDCTPEETGSATEDEEASASRASETIPPAEEAGDVTGPENGIAEKAPAEPLRAEEEKPDSDEEPAPDKEQKVKIKLESDNGEADKGREEADQSQAPPAAEDEQPEETAASEKHDLESSDDIPEAAEEDKAASATASQAELAKIEEELLSMSEDDEDGEDDAQSADKEADPAEFLDKLTDEDKQSGKDAEEPDGAEHADSVQSEDGDSEEPEKSGNGEEAPEAEMEASSQTEEEQPVIEQNMVDDLFKQMSGETATEAASEAEPPGDVVAEKTSLETPEEAGSDAPRTEEEPVPDGDEADSVPPEKPKPGNPGPAGAV